MIRIRKTCATIRKKVEFIESERKLHGNVFKTSFEGLQVEGSIVIKYESEINFNLFILTTNFNVLKLRCYYYQYK